MSRELPESLRSALRAFRRRPGLLAAAVLTLALGIGANIAVFSTAYGVLLRPLPYPDSDRLAMVWAQWLEKDMPKVSHTGGDYAEYRRAATTFEDFAALGSIRQNLTGGDEPQQVQVGWVSQNFFSVLRIVPVLGRDFAADEGSRSLILGNEFWRRHLGGDPAILGRTVELDGQPFAVVGILPAGFKLHLAADVGISTRIDVWKTPDPVTAPARWTIAELNFSTLRIIGRMKPGTTVEQAQADLDAIAEAQRKHYPDHQAVGFHLKVEPLLHSVVGFIDRSLVMLQLAVLFLLLVTCLNVANLLIVFARLRQREFALRICLGGGPGNLIRQVLTESLLISLAGGALGLALARLGLSLLQQLAPPSLPRLETIGFYPPVLAFALGVTLLTTLLIGLIPALRIAGKLDLGQVLKQHSKQAGTGDTRLRRLLIAAEVSLSFVLLLGMGLLLQSFVKLQSIRPGFDPPNLLTFSISLPRERYEAPAGTAEFLRRLEERLQQLPGVESAGTVWPLPFEGQIWAGPYRTLTGKVKEEAQPLADYRLVTPNYLTTIGARILEGRNFWQDDDRVVLVDRQFAELNWPGQSAIGQAIYPTPDNDEVSLKVIGVVENIRHKDLRADGRETLYLPAKGFSWSNWELTPVVRTKTAPLALVPGVRQVLKELDPRLPMAKVKLMEDYIAEAVAPNRFAFTMMLVFSAIALALAAIGLFGVMAYSLSQRTTEIGVRMALGAERGSILKQAVGQGLSTAAVGIGLGVLGSLALTRGLSSLLFGVSATDPATYLGAGAVLLAVATLASYLPARRAAALSPTVAIRED